MSKKKQKTKKNKLKLEDMVRVQTASADVEYEMKQIYKLVVKELQTEGLNLDARERYKEIDKRVKEKLKESPNPGRNLVAKYGEPETDQEKAELIVVEAMYSPGPRALELAKLAMKIDPLNVDSYHFIAYNPPGFDGFYMPGSIQEASFYFETGVDIWDKTPGAIKWLEKEYLHL